jgi:hypothetical protein
MTKKNYDDSTEENLRLLDELRQKEKHSRSMMKVKLSLSL